MVVLTMNETHLFIYFKIIRGNCQLVWKYSNRCWNIYLTETKYLLKLYFKFISISITHIHIDTSNVCSFPLKMYIVYSGFVVHLVLWISEIREDLKREIRSALSSYPGRKVVLISSFCLFLAISKLNKHSLSLRLSKQKSQTLLGSMLM